MKKILFTLLMAATMLGASAHNFFGCKNSVAGVYSFNGNTGSVGLATVTYQNSFHVTIGTSFTVSVPVGGAVSFNVNFGSIASGAKYITLTWSDTWSNSLELNALTSCSLAVLELNVISAKTAVGSNLTTVLFRGESTEINDETTLIFEMKDGSKKNYVLVLKELLKPTDTWEVIVDNKLGKVLSLKKK